MLEIRDIRSWTQVQSTGETEYFVDVYLVAVIEPVQWRFGTNKRLWERVTTVMREDLAGFVTSGLCNGCGQEIFLPPRH